MNKPLLVAFSAVVAVVVAPAAGQNQITVTRDGWTVTADTARSVVRISHAKLGAILENGQLNIEEEHGLKRLGNWTVEKKGPDALSIRTSEPPSGWLFGVEGNALRISSTTAEAVLVAEAPAPADRVVARTMDSEGIPVTWVGTNEVGDSWGGHDTRNPSFLPRRNPECMYFALGQISGTNFHALFDRPTDTAIQFPESARLKRNARDPDRLDMTLPVPGNALVRVVPDYFTKTLGVPFYSRFDDTHFQTAPMIWCSWTSYYNLVSEQDIVRNTDWIAQNLKSYGFEYVQMDDGYDTGPEGQHWWIEHWDKKRFPHGPKWLAQYIRSKGLHPGLWLVPNAYAGAVKQHPDWYLRDRQGNFIINYSTPSLDSTNPEVLAFLRHLFRTLTDWGFEYFKFDGEFAMPKYAPNVDPRKLYDRSIDPMTAYRNRLKLIRETVGPKTFLEGCPAGTPLNGIGYFNSYFNGHDLWNDWQGMHPLFSSINGNAFLNHMAVYVMPGEGIEVGTPMTPAEAVRKRNSKVIQTVHDREKTFTGLGVTLPEARTLVSLLGLTGVAYPVASILPELPEERVQLLKMTLPTVPILPVDLFSRGTDMELNTFRHTEPDYYIHNYPEIIDLKVNTDAGVYDVAGFTNWRTWPATREISFADKLGLEATTSYVVFDFWNQRLVGVFRDRITVRIEPHDTRVLLLHSLLNRPQLIGTSRHITGAYSVVSQQWDSARNSLRGTSRTVPGAPYSLWIYIPEGFKFSGAEAVAGGGANVPLRHELNGHSLKITFAGEQQPVDWKIRFTPRSGA